MARGQKAPIGIPKGKLPASADQLLDELVTGPMTAEAVQDTLMQRSVLMDVDALAKRW